MIVILLAAYSLHKTDTKLFVDTQVAALEHGKLKMPSGTDEVIIEIGCSDRNTADDEILPRMNRSFLISFEPLLDKYAILLAKGTKRYHKLAKDRAVPIGHHHQRGVALPFAISEHGGKMEFHVSNVAGCSSLLNVKKKPRFGKFCTNIMENRTVDTLSVSEMIDILPSNVPVRHMKLDMQGLDGTIIKLLPSQFLQRVQSLRFEATTPKCGNLYDNQIQCAEIEEFLKSHEFHGTCPDKCEVSPLFKKMNR